ncbi:MAG: DsbA family protein [Acidobacteriota bacterium]|nr:DsbA family protein [Acidobacteriota bacterium]
MKRTLQAGLIICALAGVAALWAQQSPTGTPLPAQIEQRVEAYLRHYYAWGPQFTVKAETPKPSLIPDLYEVPVEISFRGQTETAKVFISHNGKYMIRGELTDLLVDPFAAARAKLDVGDHPHLGPAKACVNVVEFADFQCPHCKEANEALTAIEPQYPDVKFTFMDFPLTQLHPWALKAALAGRCAYKQNPALYPKYRGLIFAQQDQITADNASDKLLNLASQAGLNASTLTACMADPATKAEVEADENLGKSLNVNSTPTLFVNGRPMIGGTEQLLEQFIGYEQDECKAHASAAAHN